ncbi:hypothetical protein [Flavobacterium sp.]|jgi:hypothetical protein|uniref:hypothetical protein n=1 Tax=Flavobacterium sp. TaxID=239 RepID=UPI003919148C
MKKLIFGIIAILFCNLVTSQNKFDENSARYYNFLKEKISLIKNGLMTEEQMKILISEKKFTYTSNLSMEYINNNQRIFEEIIKSDSVSLIKIEDRLLNQKDVDPILEFLSYYKYILRLNSELGVNTEIESKGDFCYNCWEMCTNICMSRKLRELRDNSNWIDQAVFVLTAAESTLQMYASCSWDCYKKYR